MEFITDTVMIFDERAGRLHGYDITTKKEWSIGTVPNVLAEGEGGLLGLAKDYDFATNRTMYACYNAIGRKSVRVTKFTLSADYKTASGFTDIITDIQSQAGRHSGCRMEMDKNGMLWIGTGDSAIGTAAQNQTSLAGKILRVDRNGKGVEGNLKAPADTRIYNYGHRNIQGLVLFDKPLANGAVGLTAEHGPDKEDEINWLKPGNYGWNPNGTGGKYDESVPMTDLTKYPDAVPAIWNSGSSTIAVSGMSFLTSSRWSAWQGYLVVAALKGQQVRLIYITVAGKLVSQQEILKDFGRVRAVTEAPNGDLYLSTDNGNNSDKIIRVVPSTN
jgi:glucose/arabinose dehydrogenase